LLSDIPVHREFHGDSSELFEINNDPSNLAAIAIRIANDYPSWRELSLSGLRLCNSLTLNGQQSSIFKLLNE